MKLVDVNLLLYAVNADAALHSRARVWLERALAGPETVAFSWNVLLAFLRVTTRPGLFERPIPVDSAFELLESWLAQPTVTVIHPGRGHLRILRDLLAPLGTGGNLTSDAHLAALALEHGAELCSCDRDFARFPALRWQDPLR